MKKMRFSLTKILCGITLLMSGTAIGQRGPIIVIPPAVTSGTTHATNIYEDCSTGTAQIEANFSMKLASFIGDGTYRVVTKLYKGDWTISGMGRIVTNEVLVTSIPSSGVVFPLIFMPIGGTYPMSTATFYSTAPHISVTKNGTYRMTTTLQFETSPGVYTDQYTTPLSSVYVTLDVPPYTTFGDLAEVAHVENLKIGTNFGFSINGNSTDLVTHVTCPASPLMLTNVTNWVGNSGTATLKVDQGVMAGSPSAFVQTATASLNFPVTGADQNLSTLFPTILTSTYSGPIRITYNLPNDDCYGTLTPVVKTMTVIVNTPAFAGDYTARSPNAPSAAACAVTGLSKALYLTPIITTPMPSNTTSYFFKCELKSASGWYGATSAGIKDLIFSGAYAVDVYEVDPTTGVRGPSIYLNTGVQSGNDEMLFNASDNGAEFDASAPYYVSTVFPASATGSGGSSGNYFLNYYNWAKLNSALTAMSNKVFCTEVSQTPVGGCPVLLKSYFRIANNGYGSSAGGQGARLSGYSEDDDEIEYMPLAIYPNPTTGELHIPVSSDDTNVSMMIIDNLGKKVLSISDVKAKNGSVNIEQLSAGVYFYIINKDNSLFRGKIVKQ